MQCRVNAEGMVIPILESEEIREMYPDLCAFQSYGGAQKRRSGINPKITEK